MKNLYSDLQRPGRVPRTAVGLAATVALVGIIFLWRRRPGVVVLFGATTCALLVAGVLGMYPIGQRFLVFLLPIVVLCLAEGVAGIVGYAPRLLAAGLLFGVAALIVAPVVGTAAKRLVDPPKGEEIEPLIHEVVSNWRQGDVLYLYSQSQYAFRYYVECNECGAMTSLRPRALAFASDRWGPAASDACDRVRLAEPRRRDTLGAPPRTAGGAPAAFGCSTRTSSR